MIIDAEKLAAIANKFIGNIHVLGLDSSLFSVSHDPLKEDIYVPTSLILSGDKGHYNRTTINTRYINIISGSRLLNTDEKDNDGNSLKLRSLNLNVVHGPSSLPANRKLDESLKKLTDSINRNKKIIIPFSQKGLLSLFDTIDNYRLTLPAIKEIQGFKLRENNRIMEEFEALESNTDNDWEAYELVVEKNNTYEPVNMYYLHIIRDDSWLHMVHEIMIEEEAVLIMLADGSDICIDTSAIHNHPASKIEEGVNNQYNECWALCLNNPALKRDETDEKGLKDELRKELFSAEALQNNVERVKERFSEEQEDPYIDRADMGDVALEFLSGSKEDLEIEIRDIFYATVPRNVWLNSKITELEVRIKASDSDDNHAEIDFENMEYGDESWGAIEEKTDDKVVRDMLNKINTLAEVAISNNEPHGYTWEYNDGAYNRASGYDKSALTVSFTLSVPSASEQAAAMLQVRKKYKGLLSNKILDGVVV